MNLLRILDEAKRRLGLNRQESSSIVPPAADPDLVDRIRHGLKRPMNRRELFRFTAIAAAVGTPAVRDLILSPAKTIVVPPAPAVAIPSTAEVIASQLEKVRGKLPVVFAKKEAERL